MKKIIKFSRIMSFVIVLTGMMPAAGLIDIYYLTHSNNVPDETFNVTVITDGEAKNVSVQISSSSEIYSLLGIEKFVYNLDNPVDYVSEDNWTTNTGSSKADGFGSFLSNKNRKLGNVSGIGIIRPVVFTLNNTFNTPILKNTRNSTVAAHVYFEDGYCTWCTWVSDGISKCNHTIGHIVDSIANQTIDEGLDLEINVTFEDGYIGKRGGSSHSGGSDGNDGCDDDGCTDGGCNGGGSGSDDGCTDGGCNGGGSGSDDGCTDGGCSGGGSGGGDGCTDGGCSGGGSGGDGHGGSSLEGCSFHDHTMTINWGDGINDTIYPAISPLHVNHTYEDDQNYTASIIVTDEDGRVGTDSVDFSVNNIAPIVSSNLSNVRVQWSDPISIKIQATDTRKDWPFSISTSWKNKEDTTFISSLPDGLTLTDEICTHGGIDKTCTWVLSGRALIPPGTYIIRIEVMDDDGASSFIDITIEVTQEDARATYTGAHYSSTSSVMSSRAVVTLSATIQDITAVTDDIDHDSYPGDIRNANVRFIDRENNEVVCSSPVGLVSSSDLKTGTVTCDWVVDIGKADSKSFIVGIVIDNYYNRNATIEDTVLTISKPVENSITGGGYIIMTNSEGLYSGAPDTKTNFGFNVKYNKKGTNLQGHVTIIIRNDERVYKIKSNAIDQLSVNSNAATFNSRANIEDVTDPLNPIPVDGNAALQMTLTDNPESADLIGITLYNRNGGLWYSSHWNGVRTIEKILGGGNLAVS